MRLLIIFILMLSNSFASDASDIKNLVINKELKNYSDITFLNIKNKELNLKDYKGNLVLLNFWATWCAPCKDEMPSLDLLAENPNFKVGYYLVVSRPCCVDISRFFANYLKQSFFNINMNVLIFFIKFKFFTGYFFFNFV